MAVIGELATLVTARVEPFKKGLDQASAKARTFSGTLKSVMGKALSSVSTMLTRAAAGVTALGVALTTGLVIKSVQLAAKAESMQVSYKVYLKSLEKANALLAEITKFSDATPFEPDEIKEAGKQLLAFGFSADQIMPTIKVLGDIAAGSQKPIADFVDILGKVKASGIASMADINRLADRGVPVFQELSRVMGVSTSEVRKLVGSAKVGFDDVWQVLKNVTSEGGLFNDAMIELSKTFSAKLGTLSGKIKGIMTKVGTAIIEGMDFKKLEDALINLTDVYGQDVINATTEAVKMLQGVLSTAPSWIEEIKTIYFLYQIGVNRIQKFGQIMPGGSFAANYFFNREGDPTKTDIRLDKQYNNLVTAYQNAKTNALTRRVPSLEEQKPGSNQDKSQRETQKTLIDIYREHAKTNQLLMQQQSRVIPSF